MTGLILFACGATVVLAPATAYAQLQESSKRECAICHIMWLTDFKRDDVTPLVPYDPRPTEASGKQDIVSTERMCFSCHDGYVLDSRKQWKSGRHGHPVGVVSSERVKLPTPEGKVLFPLNDDGKVYCGTCHSAHGVSWDQTESPVFLRMANIESSICVACHLDDSTGLEDGNHPVFTAIDELPQSLLDEGARFGVQKGLLCQSCHRVHGAREQKILLVRNDASQLCGTCHADRYAKTRAEARRSGTHPVNVDSSGAAASEAIVEQGGRLGPDSQVICQSCHRPHRARLGTKILVADNADSALCQTCHSQQAGVRGTKHDLGLADGAPQNARGQTVASAGVCSACHLAHEGNGPNMWARALDASGDVTSALCLGCHRKDGLAAEHLVGEHSHPVGVAPDPVGDALALPLFAREGARAEPASGAGLVSCPTCHDPHRWDPHASPDSARLREEGDASNSFLRKANDGTSALCTACHVRQAAVNGSKHDIAAVAPQALRGKAPQGVCDACHLPHNGRGPRMWALDPARGADPTAAACLGCHERKRMAAKKTVGTHSHPVNVSVRDLGLGVGDGKWTSPRPLLPAQRALEPLPLYDERGRSAPGADRVGCATCHDPHVWAAGAKGRPGRDPAKVEGGPHDSFLRLPDDARASLCVNCHTDKAAVLSSKHDARRFEDVRGEATGVGCRTCHQPHNAGPSFLWSRKTGPGEHAIERLCADCHRSGGPAEKAVPGGHSHPLGTASALDGGSIRLPLFSAEGAPTRRGGEIDCATCHDPHQWDPRNPASTSSTDRAAEGDGATSFLRLAAAPDAALCTECHADKKWVVGTDHDLAVTAPEAVNAQGRRARQSGVCGQCHAPHDAAGPLVLWARDLGLGENTMEQMCRSCHVESGLGHGRSPPESEHPSQIRAWSDGARNRTGDAATAHMPVYDASGQPSASGVISCPTCHNPHRWSPHQQRSGAGRDEEGDAMSSFLRLDDTRSFLCADCHGLDALFRYKYFHQAQSRGEHPLYR